MWFVAGALLILEFFLPMGGLSQISIMSGGAPGQLMLLLIAPPLAGAACIFAAAFLKDESRGSIIAAIGAAFWALLFTLILAAVLWFPMGRAAATAGLVLCWYTCLVFLLAHATLPGAAYVLTKRPDDARTRRWVLASAIAALGIFGLLQILIVVFFGMPIRFNARTAQEAVGTMFWMAEVAAFLFAAIGGIILGAGRPNPALARLVFLSGLLSGALLPIADTGLQSGFQRARATDVLELIRTTIFTYAPLMMVGGGLADRLLRANEQQATSLRRRLAEQNRSKRAISSPAAARKPQ